MVQIVSGRLIEVKVLSFECEPHDYNINEVANKFLSRPDSGSGSDWKNCVN